MSAGQRGLDPATPLAPTATGLILLQELRAGSVVAERFRIERILGIGGMGLVYQARDLELDVDVALKQLRPELAARADAFERFRKELLLARSVSSPHVVRIHDLVRHEQTWLISMDYVPGRSLERLLQEERRLDPERALAITRQIALGLAAAHESGVVHRDLKPANILIDDADQARITDFGVARAAGDTGITGSGVVIGTPEYLSPEQARAEPLDGRSDLYALGLILFEMLTGTLPFRGGTPAEMMIQRVVQSPPRADSVVPGLPAFAVELCARLLTVAASDRMPDAGSIVRAIDARHLESLAAPTVPNRSPIRWAMGMIFAVLVALAVVSIARWSTSSGAFPWLTNTTPQASPDLDLLPLPWTVRSSQADDAEAAAGAWYLLAERLNLNSGMASADPARVLRILATLGFDGEAADRQHDRVLQVSSATRLLEGDWERKGALLELRVRLIEANRNGPLWQWQRSGVTDAELPSVLQELQVALASRLNVALPTTDWPELRALVTLGGLLGDRADEAVRQSAPDSEAGATTAWIALARLDQSGLAADAGTTARAMLDGLTDGQTGPAYDRLRAYARLLIGELEAAETLFRMLLLAHPSDHPSRLLWARTLAEQGRFDEASEVLKDLLTEDPENGRAWYEQGRYALQKGDAKQAIDELLVRAQVIANRLGDDRLRAEVANAMGYGFRRLGQMQAAADELERAVAIRSRIGDPRGEAASLTNLAVVRSIQGLHEPAQTALARAKALVEPLGDTVALADLANVAGSLAEEEGNFTRALESYREALNLRQAQGDSRSIAESQLNVGFAYFQLGEYDNAQTYWAQAKARYDELDDEVGQVHSQESLGLAGIARGDWGNAREVLLAGLHTAEALQMDEEQANGLAILGELDRLQGRYAEALAGAEAALVSFARRDDVRGATEMHLLRAQVFLDIGNWEQARTILDSMANNPPDNAEQLGMYRVRRAELALGLGDPSHALTILSDAPQSTLTSDTNAVLVQAHGLRALALSRLGDTQGSATALQLARQALSRAASVPLRLALAEVELSVSDSSALQSWRAASALLARLPSYGRSWRLGALARSNGAMEGGTQADARLAQSIREIHDALPERFRSDFLSFAKIQAKELLANE